MKLHELKSIKKRVQRIGRSGKRGSYSGRGVKGQKSRAGRRLRPAERDLIMRLPKLRGFRNKTKSEKAIVFNLQRISDNLKSFVKSGAPLEVNKELLRVAGLLRKSDTGEIKILGTGEIAFAVRTSGIKVSDGAKIKIEKAGGSVARE